MTIPLDDEQKAAFDKMMSTKVGALFMDMGTGKTLTAFQVIGNTPGIDFVLWICPFGLKDEAMKEYTKWQQTFKIELVACESISSSERIYLEVLKMIEGKKVFCVVDESLKIKNRDALRTERIIEIGKYCEYKLILNGTPISKNILDIWSQMEFLSHKILKMSFPKFRSIFTEYDEETGHVKEQKNMELLMKLIGPYIFESKLNLDVEKNYYDHEYDCDTIEEYNKIKRKYINNYSTMAFFAMSTELQHCYTRSAEREKLLDRIVSNGEQFLVYVKYLDNIKGNHITGKESLKKRREILKAFEHKDFNVLYLTYGVGGYGLNLQFCHNIIFADQTFDYAEKIQAEHRVYRKGQTNTVHYHNLWCNCGMENIIRACLRKKVKLLEEIKTYIFLRKEKLLDVI